MSKGMNIKLLLFIVVSLADEAILLAIIMLVLGQLGIEMPPWFIILLGLLFLVITLVIYRSLGNSPQLGFDNMIGQNGFAVNPIAPKGTVRIRGELWQAVTKSTHIEAGAEIVVLERTGLNLTVLKKIQDEAVP
jgi:membrane-bound ClpP family serine protease